MKPQGITIRTAEIRDIPQIQKVRHSVKENVLSDPSLVTDKDCVVFLTKRGKGWVAELNEEIVGFAIADLEEDNIWALFVHPDAEAKGIGSQLHKIMLDWYFEQGKSFVWLSTDPGTRAERFYEWQGWQRITELSNGEVKFEMKAEDWRKELNGNRKYGSK